MRYKYITLKEAKRKLQEADNEYKQAFLSDDDIGMELALKKQMELELRIKKLEDFRENKKWQESVKRDIERARNNNYELLKDVIMKTEFVYLGVDEALALAKEGKSIDEIKNYDLQADLELQNHTPINKDTSI